MSDIYVEVNLHNLYHNISKIKRELSNKKTMVMGVVKSNAYGHGIVEISKALRNHVSYIGVGLLNEAITLRENGIEEPIFLMGPTIDFEKVYNYNITLSICSIEQLKALISYTNDSGNVIKIHLKVETGMNRFGINYQQIDEARNLLQSQYIEFEGVYSHFATTYKNNKAFVIKQKEQFDKYVKYFENKYDNLIFHIANSENTIDFKEAHYNMVRIGNALYGPCNSKKRIGLKKVSKIKAKVIYKKHVSAKEFIGYGNSYRAKEDMMVGIIPFGFYEGISLYKKPIGSKFISFIIFYLKEIFRYLFRSKTVVCYNEMILEILGKPNMQYTIIDITDIDNNEDDIIVDIRISPIFIKENIDRIYVAEVKN